MTTIRIPRIASGHPLPKTSADIQRKFRQLSVRNKFLLATTVGFLLAVLTMLQTLYSYNNTYKLFEKMVLNNSVKVDASEKSIQDIANVNKYAADYIANFDDLAKRSTAFINLHLDFAKFRDQMFILHDSLRDFADTKEFLVAEQKVYEKYWGSMSNLLLARRQGDRVTATDNYEKVDDFLENSIIPALQKIEKFNFEAMVEDKSQSIATIYGQLLILTAAGIGLAILLTITSFWLRVKIKRLLTPGLDSAALLSWIFALALIIQFASLPSELNVMVTDAYYSISGGSRVLAVANQANRTKSAALNDPAHAKNWQAKFDTYFNKLQLTMCGQPTCLQTSFSTAPNSDTANPAVIRSALNISSNNAALIDNIKPLVVNATFPGEVRALEKARSAYIEYMRYDAQIRTLLQQNNVAEASKISTGASDQAFAKFVQALQEEHDINQQIFDGVWERQKAALSSYPLIFGVAGYGLLLLLIVAGVLHRYREL